MCCYANDTDVHIKGNGNSIITPRMRMSLGSSNLNRTCIACSKLQEKSKTNNSEIWLVLLSRTNDSEIVLLSDDYSMFKVLTFYHHHYNVSISLWYILTKRIMSICNAIRLTCELFMLICTISIVHTKCFKKSYFMEENLLTIVWYHTCDM